MGQPRGRTVYAPVLLSAAPGQHSGELLRDVAVVRRHSGQKEIKGIANGQAGGSEQTGQPAFFYGWEIDWRGNTAFIGAMFWRDADENLVPKGGLEPPPPCEYMDLNHAPRPTLPLQPLVLRPPPIAG